MNYIALGAAAGYLVGGVVAMLCLLTHVSETATIISLVIGAFAIIIIGSSGGRYL